MRIEPLVGTGNGHRLGDGAARELIDVDFHAQLIERLLGRIKLGHLAGRRRHLQFAALGIVEQLRVLAGRHEPRADDGNDGHDEQNRERRREGELALLPFLFGLGGRDGNGFHGCLSHDDLLSESGRNAAGSSHGPPSESLPAPLPSITSPGRLRWLECRGARRARPRHKTGRPVVHNGYNLEILRRPPSIHGLNRRWEHRRCRSVNKAP